MIASKIVLILTGLAAATPAAAGPSQADPHQTECDARIDAQQRVFRALARRLADASPADRALLETDAGVAAWKLFTDVVVKPDVPPYCLDRIIGQVSASAPKTTNSEPPVLKQSGLPKALDEPASVEAQYRKFLSAKHPNLDALAREWLVRDAVRSLSPESLVPR